MVVGQKFDKRRGGLSVKGRWVSFVRCTNPFLADIRS